MLLKNSAVVVMLGAAKILTGLDIHGYPGICRAWIWSDIHTLGYLRGRARVRLMDLDLDVILVDPPKPAPLPSLVYEDIYTSFHIRKYKV